jgi:hypothetical protein
VRTTLKIDDDVLEAAWCIAADEGVSVGEIMSRLARRGLEPRDGERTRRRFPAFTVAPGAPPMTPGMVTRAVSPDDRSDC